MRDKMPCLHPHLFCSDALDDQHRACRKEDLPESERQLPHIPLGPPQQGFRSTTVFPARQCGSRPAQIPYDGQVI
jgi:hypothetical protein